MMLILVSIKTRSRLKVQYLKHREMNKKQERKEEVPMEITVKEIQV